MGGRDGAEPKGLPLRTKVRNTFFNEADGTAAELEDADVGVSSNQMRQVSEPLMQWALSGHAVALGSAGGIAEESDEGPEPETEKEPALLAGDPFARQESHDLGSPTGNLLRQETQMNWPVYSGDHQAKPMYNGDDQARPMYNGDDQAPLRLPHQDGPLNGMTMPLVEGSTMPAGGPMDMHARWQAVYAYPNESAQMPGHPGPMAPPQGGMAWGNAMTAAAAEVAMSFDPSLADAAMQHLQDPVGGGARTCGPTPKWADVHTVMMRNLPNKYTQHMLLEELNRSGFLGTFDFLYLPIDPETNANRGYAFINFIDPESAWMLRMTYEGRKMSRFNSEKVVSVSPAALQGFEANYAHYSTARVNRGVPALRPLFLRESSLKGKLPKGGQGRRRGGRRSTGSLIDVAARRQQEFHGGGMMATGPGMAAPPSKQAFGSSAGPNGAQYVGLSPMAGGQGKMMAPNTDQSSHEQSKQPRFCPYCGGKCMPDFKFCKFCGAALAVMQE